MSVDPEQIDPLARETKAAGGVRQADCGPGDVANMLAADPYFQSLIEISEKAKKEAIPHLTRALQSDGWHVRWQAVRLLGSLGSDEKDAVRVLKAKLEDPNAFVRYAAVGSLWSIGRYYER